HNFLGIIETDHAQIPIHAWLSNTATSQEDVFILIMEPIRKIQPDSELIILYKAIADYSPNIVSVYDADLNCIYVNHNAHRQLGHSLGDYYTNSGFLQFIDPSYRSVLLSDIEKDNQKRVQFSKYYYLARRKSGEQVKVINFITRIFGADDQLHRIVANERISSVEANTLTTTKAQEELILADAHYLIHYVSQQTEKALGIGQGSSPSLFSIIYPDDHAKLLANQGQTHDTVAVSNSQLRILQSPDSFRLVDASIHRFFNASGQMVYIAVRWPNSDTEEDSLWQSVPSEEQHQFIELAEDLQGSASLLVQEDLTIRYISPEAEALLGYSSSEVYGRDIMELIPADSRDVIKKQLTSAFTQSVSGVVGLIKKKDETHQPFDITLKIIQEDGSLPVLFITLDAMSFTDPKLFQL
ncbi:MAG: PAS domain S-box protein, partial [Bacteroidota bacterium]